MSSSSKVNLKFITRMAYNRTMGWNVRVLLPNGTTHCKLFSDLKYGSRNKALSKAINYRDKMVKTLKIEYKLKIPYKMTGPRERYKTSTSGIVGVIRVVDIKPSGEYFSWKSYWWDRKEKTTKTKHFSVIKYGECDAFRQTCRARFNMGGTLYVYKDRAKYKTPCPIPRDVAYKFIKS